MINFQKAPSTKRQHPEKLQIPSFKLDNATLRFGYWGLVFLWSLGIGAWSFPSCI
jgi:hypothetical protein